MSVYFVLTNKYSILPTYGSKFAAGMDLYSAEESIIPPKGKALIDLGLQVGIPSGYYGRMAPRSGLAAHNFIHIGAGVIDEDFRGNLKALLFNFSDEYFHVNIGDRIAQLVIEKILHADIVRVEELDETERGIGGFGSTGI
jgi:deoxyuridine 5'-triphosphate nucleotidohydrolase